MPCRKESGLKRHTCPHIVKQISHAISVGHSLKITGKEHRLGIRKKAVPEKLLIEQAMSMPPVKDFAAALSRKDRFNIIAELKKASPSKGLIREDFVPEKLCLELESNGAAALSVLTEEFFFLGAPEYLKKVAALVKIPTLRKDFIFDSYQIYEARVLGADAVLLIAAALDEKTFSSLSQVAKHAGLHVLSEIHNRVELESTVRCGAQIIGINCLPLIRQHGSLHCVTMQLPSGVFP